MEPKTIVLYGRSGSGKGTQVELLKRVLAERSSERGIFSIETGEEFRVFINSDSYTSSLSRKVMEEGGLQPEFLPVWIWTSVFVKNFKGNEHIICDGLVRRYAEALVFDSAMRFYGRARPDVLLLDVSPQCATERLLLRGRHDDTPDAIKRRLAWFKTDVSPAIDYFKTNDYYHFVTIDGEQTVEDVHKDVLAAIGLAP